VNKVRKSFCPTLLSDFAVKASLAASVVVFTPAGALMLLPALAVAAAEFRLLLVDKNMVIFPNSKLSFKF
jgi:hypothetical protein